MSGLPKWPEKFDQWQFHPADWESARADHERARADAAMARLRVCEAALSDIDASANGPSAIPASPKYDPWGIANYCIERAGKALMEIGELPED
jgi:hypothetical protein